MASEDKKNAFIDRVVEGFDLRDQDKVVEAKKFLGNTILDDVQFRVALRGKMNAVITPTGTESSDDAFIDLVNYLQDTQATLYVLGIQDGVARSNDRFQKVLDQLKVDAEEKVDGEA